MTGLEFIAFSLIVRAVGHGTKKIAKGLGASEGAANTIGVACSILTGGGIVDASGGYADGAASNASSKIS